MFYTTNLLVTIVATALVVILLLDVTSAQITFSKDWRPGGKRAVDNYGCQQMADLAVIKIRELIRKGPIFMYIMVTKSAQAAYYRTRESLNILHCESDNHMTAPNDSVK
ncbi:unnamed protein product [Medioppia subpectinata]|uniref:Uncharacterized protein n=1 Tax=Medioppia subpectinata TaxID=1979941 RepID=A0A7R9KKD6_9ACAR|nr:unnamed protein product [Medioppia subpectinata]CAG2105188.1 unnamed protein product [Medioppia subpectinata]